MNLDQILALARAVMPQQWYSSPVGTSNTSVEQNKPVEKPAAPTVDPIARAKAAVMGRIREQQQQGIRPKEVAPGITTQMRPTGGVIVNTPDIRTVTGRHGGGRTVSPSTTKTIEGIPAAQWFQDAARRQGQRVVVGGYDKGSIFEPV